MSALQKRTTMEASLFARRVRRAVTALAAPLLAITCSKGDGGPAGTSTGSLAVAVSGLPSDAFPSISITGPSGYTHTLAGPETLTGLTAGSYTVASQRVHVGDAAYDPQPAEQTVTVAAGKSPAHAAVAFGVQTGALALTVAGLPNGATAAVTISGPGSFNATITTSTTLRALAPGTYTIAAANVSAAGNSFAASTPTQNVSIAASPVTSSATVTYAVTTGGVAVSLDGLPSGSAGAAELSGPNGFHHVFATSETLTNLTPGAYTLTADPVEVAGDMYTAAGVPATLQIPASLTPVSAPVSYALATGRLSMATTGLPAGAAATFSITGPGGFATSATAGGVVSGLVPGEYVITANPVTAGVNVYTSSPATKNVAIAASTAPTTVSFSYVLASGQMAVAIVGLPQSVTGNVTISGPDGFSTTIATTQVLTGLTPGAYQVIAGNALAGSNIYAGSPATQQVTIVVSTTPTPVTVNYVLASGSIAITVNGLPDGLAANITVTGPGGYNQPVFASGLLLGLAPGLYTIAAGVVSDGGSNYSAQPASQNVTVIASLNAVSASVSYTVANGSLVVTISGLPNGVAAAVTVSGPSGFRQNLTASATLPALLGGHYTVSGASVQSGGTTYNPLPVSQTVNVIAGTAATASITYAAVGGGLDLLIDGAYISQTVQTYGGTVPLVANKAGLLRVFVKATQVNSATPSVRARFYNGATLVNSISIPAPGPSVPTTVDQSILTSSWNVGVPAAVLQPGISMLIDVDPTNAVAESSESNNSFPASGTAAALDVRSLSTFQITLVPVAQSANGLTGNVSGANKDQFLSLLAKLYPVSTMDIQVRATYTTAAPALDAGDNNGAWSQILSEINALRTSDVSLRYYYGVVKVGYGSGVAGLGYVPGWAAIGWDNLPSATEVLTHELGHNFGRWHAPCGGVAGPDPSYPYVGGKIGVYGYDLVLASLKVPAQPDIMGYCPNVWISDYNYKGILAYRQANPLIAGSSNPARPGLLVWGRIRNGQVILEPAYDVVAPARLPSRTGRYRLDVRSDEGTSIFSLAFDGERIADSPNADETFAFVVPREMFRGRDVARVRIDGASIGAERREQTSVRRPLVRDASELPRATRAGGVIRLQTTMPDAQGMLVRDPRTGEILTFGRGRTAVVRSTAPELLVTVSNGVRSEQHRIRVR